MKSLIVSGAGDLGARVAKIFLGKCDITLETRGTTKHSLYSNWPVKLKLLSEKNNSAYDSLLISYPPSIENYLDEVKRSLSLWNQKAPAIFISSTGAYVEDSGGLVDENSEVDQNSLLVKAESLARAKGAHVLRLAGLYSSGNGPHLYWHKTGVSAQNSSGYLNLIHRQDAAVFVAKLLETKHSAGIWNLSDGCPLRRSHLWQLWTEYAGSRNLKFNEDMKGLGKRVDSIKIFSALETKPKFLSFSDFLTHLRSGAVDETV